MDLVGYAEERFDAVVREFLGFARRRPAHRATLTFIPVSALHGDNVVERSAAMPWYAGEPLLAHLEGAPAAVGAADGPARLPVQYVIRPTEPPAGAATPAGWRAARCGPATRSRSSRRGSQPDRRHRGPARPLEEAAAPASVAVVLEDELDVGRGDLLARSSEAPEPVRELSATVCWLGDRPARAGDALPAQAHHPHGAREARRDRGPPRRDDARAPCRPASSSSTRSAASPAHGRRAGRRPLRGQPRHGAFILIDEATNDTVGAGMVR